MIFNNSLGIPLVFSIREEQEDAMKLSDDRYEVYVEGNYIGNKSLFAQNEDFHAIGDFLENQGFSNVEVELNGDHIIVHAANRSEADEMSNALEVYLNNR